MTQCGNTRLQVLKLASTCTSAVSRTPQLLVMWTDRKWRCPILPRRNVQSSVIRVVIRTLLFRWAQYASVAPHTEVLDRASVGDRYTPFYNSGGRHLVGIVCCVCVTLTLRHAS